MPERAKSRSMRG